MGFCRTLAAVLVLGWSVAGWAAASSDSDKAQARQLVVRGAAAFDKGDYAESLVTFRAAYELFPSPRLLYDLGMCQLKLGHSVEAANAFQAFVDAAKDDPSLPNQDTARVQLDGLAVHLGRVDLKVAPVSAQVSVDGTPSKSGTLYVSPGEHTLVFSSPGLVLKTKKVAVGAGEHTGLKMVLRTEAEEARLKAAKAKEVEVVVEKPVAVALSVSTTPTAAEVAVDTNDVGPAPTITNLPVGHHHLTAALPGYVTAASDVELLEGQPQAVELHLDRAAGPRLWTWVALGATGAAAVTAISFGASASGSASELLKEPHGPNAANALYNNAQSRAHVSNGFTVAAGVLGAVSVTLFFVEPWL